MRLKGGWGREPGRELGFDSECRLSPSRWPLWGGSTDGRGGAWREAARTGVRTEVWWQGCLGEVLDPPELAKGWSEWVVSGQKISQGFRTSVSHNNSPRPP